MKQVRNRVRHAVLGSLAVAGLAMGLVVGAPVSPAADHLEAPLVMQDGRTDINDMYVFMSPTNPDNTVLVMTVNPLAGVLSPTTFDADARYRFMIDTNGDGRRNERIVARFGEPDADGNQSLRIGGSVDRGRGTTGETIPLRNGGTAFAGTFDDPFFFDFQAFQDQVKGAGGSRTFCDGQQTDFFAGANVSAIVLEVPTASIAGYDDSTFGVWGETRGSNGRVDRMGKPAIATVLIDDGNEDIFNFRRPRRDIARFGDQVTENLLFLSGLDGTGYTEDEARGVTDVLLPDILTYDATQPTDYLNGRGLADDVIDLSLTVVTGGLGENGTPVLTSDCVDANDAPFGAQFPYLAPANQV